MLYILVFVCPPLAVLGAGKFFGSIMNALLCLTIIGMPLAMIHAWYAVKESYAPVKAK